MRFSFYLFVFPALLVLVGGCHSDPASSNQAQAAATHYYYVDTDSNQGGQQGEDPSKVAESKVTKADLAALAKKKDAAESAMKASPTDANKKSFVDTTNLLASKTMDCGDLTPKEKYPEALRLYRSVLKVDPHNKDAGAAVDTIIAVYKSLGRPVPKE